MCFHPPLQAGPFKAGRAHRYRWLPSRNTQMAMAKAIVGIRNPANLAGGGGEESTSEDRESRRPKARQVAGGEGEGSRQGCTAGRSSAAGTEAVQAAGTAGGAGEHSPGDSCLHVHHHCCRQDGAQVNRRIEPWIADGWRRGGEWRSVQGPCRACRCCIPSARLCNLLLLPHRSVRAA